MATEEKKYAQTLSFMKKKEFEGWGWVIQGAIKVEDLKNLLVRDGKVFVKFTKLKEPTQYGAEFLLTEDDYMASYGDGEKAPLGDALSGKVAEQKEAEQAEIGSVDDLFS